jgi:hypothetical protein
MAGKVKLSKTQRRALTGLSKRSDCASFFGVPVATFLALARRGLIRVDTTFDSIAFPKNARAVITKSGRAALAESSHG